MKYILGLDLGTSSAKAVVYNEKLEFVCDAVKEYPTFYPKSGWAEQPAEQWWEAFCYCSKQCLERGNLKPEDIVAVGIDSMGSIALPVDSKGNPLYAGLLWMDRRSIHQCNMIEAKVGDRLLEITGNRNDPSNIAPKILWFKQNHPEVYKKAYKFLHANGYLVHKLTGVFTMDRTEGGLSLLYDLFKGEYSDEIIRNLGIDKSKLPDIFECDEVVGRITKQASEECGLAEGTPVVAGAMDCIASALGTASVQNGDVYIAGGTVTAVGIVIDEPKPHKALHIHNHIIPGKYIWVSAVDFGGGGLRWLRNLMGETDYRKLNELAAQAPAGNNGLIFLPFMVGQRSPLYNNNTTGVVFGLTPDHQMKNIARMFMEGTSYAVRNILDYFRVAGTTPKSARLTGGIANSKTWTQIMCDIINVNIDIPGAVDVATLGSAITAGVGIGMFNSYDEALKYQQLKARYFVNTENTEIYNTMFSIFKNVFNNVLFSYDYARYALNKDLK